MKSTLRWVVALGALSAPGFLQLGCQDSFKTCEAAQTCPPEGDGDGDGDLGGSGGDGDGDGDGDGTGGSSPLTCGGAECSGETSHCSAEEECVECLENEHCDDPAPFCDTENTCVSCLENADCLSVDASLCDGGECAGCEEHADCSHLSAAPLCNSDAGICAGCLPSEDDRESDEDACGTGVCNPQTLECESALTQSAKDLCGSCIADSECLVGQNCIPLQYTGGTEPVELGTFCMKIAPGCSPPYQAGAINRASVSGVPATNYCGLAEEFTTCAAIKDLKDGKLCADDGECGSEHSEGLCRIVNLGIDNQCTYSCTGSAQCVGGFACGGTVGNEYCGG